MLNREQSTVFTDVLMNMIMCLTLIIAVILMIVNPVENNKKLDAKEEFMIYMTWDKESSDDIDMFLMSPSKNVIYYGNKVSEYIHLHRDDLGTLNDTSEFNEEKLSIRKIVPGYYILNSLVYNKKDANNTTINVEIFKLNPFSKVFTKSYVVSKDGQQDNIINFEINRNGIFKIQENEFVDIVGISKR